MKKKLLILLFMLLALSFSACSVNDEAASLKEAETEKVVNLKEDEDKNETKVDKEINKDIEKADNIPKISDNLYDGQFSVDGIVCQIPMWFSELEANGWVYTEEADKMLYPNDIEYSSWNKPGMLADTFICNYSINAKPVNECTIYAIELTDTNAADGIDIIFPKGIKLLSSTQDDVIMAYGKPSSEFVNELGNRVNYKTDDAHEMTFCFKTDGLLYNVLIKNTTQVVEGVDNTLNPDVKADSIDYVIPTELGTDILDDTFMLEGKLYSLPCPVTEFLNNGFVIEDEYIDEIVPAGDESGSDLLLDGKRLYVSLMNYSVYGTTPENCYVDYIFINDYDEDVWDIELASGLKVGSTRKELLDALEEYEYSESEKWDGLQYQLTDTGTDYYKKRIFDVEDGVIIGFDISNEKNPKDYND